MKTVVTGKIFKSKTLTRSLEIMAFMNCHMDSFKKCKSALAKILKHKENLLIDVKFG